MRLPVVLAILASSAVYAAPSRVTIRMTETAITCRVAGHEDDLWLDIGVRGYFSHGVQLDGSTQPTTHQTDLPALDCEGDEYLVAFCELFYGVKGYEIDTAHLPCH